MVFMKCLAYLAMLTGRLFTVDLISRLYSTTTEATSPISEYVQFQSEITYIPCRAHKHMPR